MLGEVIYLSTGRNGPSVCAFAPFVPSRASLVTSGGDVMVVVVITLTADFLSHERNHLADARPKMGDIAA